MTPAICSSITEGDAKTLIVQTPSKSLVCALENIFNSNHLSLPHILLVNYLPFKSALSSNLDYIIFVREIISDGHISEHKYLFFTFNPFCHCKLYQKFYCV